jgi:hypothetical protein
MRNFNFSWKDRPFIINQIGSITFLLFAYLCNLTSCQSNNNKSNIQSFDSTYFDSTYFGSYYKIGKYDIYAPFNSSPNIKEVANHKLLFNFEYRNSTADRLSGANYIYGISVYRIKDSTITDSCKKVDLVASVILGSIQVEFKGAPIENHKGIYKNKYCYKTILKIEIKQENKEGMFLFYTLTFAHKGIVFNLFVLAPIGEDSKSRAEGFFNSIKIN